MACILRSYSIKLNLSRSEWVQCLTVDWIPEKIVSRIVDGLAQWALRYLGPEEIEKKIISRLFDHGSNVVWSRDEHRTG